MIRKTEILWLLLCSSLPCMPQGIFEKASSSTGVTDETNRPVLNGYVRGSAYAGSGNFDFSTLFGEFALQSRFRSDKAFVTADLRIREGLFFDERKTVYDLKEAYAGYETDKLSLYLGNQIISWGRADGFNPTNNISPNDYFLFTPESDDQKLSNFMLRFRLRFTPAIEWELTAIPVYRPSVYRYDLFGLGTGVTFEKPDLPSARIKNGSFASRLDFEYPGIGFSFSWFHGYDPFYGFKTRSISMIPSPSIINQASFYKKETLGFDAAVPVKTWILRTELAYNFVHDQQAEEGVTLYLPYSDFSYVVGLEHDFSGFHTIFQYIGKTTSGFTPLVRPDPPSSDPRQMILYAINLAYYKMAGFNRRIFHQQEKTNHALMISLDRLFFHDLAEVNITGFYDLTSEEWFFRPSLKWKLTDHLTASLGAYRMKGPAESLFSYAGKVMNGVFTSLTYYF